MIVRDKEPESSKAGWKALGKEVETIIFEEKDDVAEVRKRLDLTLMLRIGDKMKEASRNAQGTKDMASGKHSWTTKPSAAPSSHQPPQRPAGKPQGKAGTPFAAHAVTGTNDMPYAAMAVAMNAKTRAPLTSKSFHLVQDTKCMIKATVKTLYPAGKEVPRADEAYVERYDTLRNVVYQFLYTATKAQCASCMASKDAKTPSAHKPACYVSKACANCKMHGHGVGATSCLKPPA
jgi:hypothetical protein